MPDVSARPRRRSHRVVWAVGAVLLLLAVVVGYLIWSGLSARSELKAAEQDAKTLQSALLEGDRATADAALNRFATHTDAARARTSGPLWSSASKLPWVGDDFDAVRLVAWSASEVGRQAHAALFGDTDRDLFTDLAPKNGRVDLGVVRELQPLMARLDRSLSTSTARLRKVEADGLSRFVKPSFVRFRDKLVEADGIAAGANRAVQVLPQMLGGDGPRTYLLRFENNAEVRSTGGLPGAWALIAAKDGQLTITKQGSASGDFPEFSAPVVPLTKAEQEIWGVQLATYFHDTNFIPDMPRSAEITNAMWDARFPDAPIDGIVELDVVTLSYILKATGPVKVPGTGVALTSDNAVSELLSKTYARLPDTAAQDAFFADAAKAVFDAVSQGTGSAAQLLRALSGGVEEGRVRVHSFDPAVQQLLHGSLIAGEMDFAADAPPELGIYLNDSTGSKMQYYLDTSVETTPVKCEGKAQVFSTTMTLRVPALDVEELPDYVTGGGQFGIEPGTQLISITAYGPVGGTIADLAFDREVAEDPQVDVDRDRPVLSTAAFVDQDSTVKVTWVTTTRPDQRGPLTVTTTPGLESRPFVARADAACR